MSLYVYVLCLAIVLMVGAEFYFVGMMTHTVQNANALMAASLPIR